eukprot:3418095-Heterocapsa_arctica.AAC.1
MSKAYGRGGCVMLQPRSQCSYSWAGKLPYPRVSHYVKSRSGTNQTGQQLRDVARGVCCVIERRRDVLLRATHDRPASEVVIWTAN